MRRGIFLRVGQQSDHLAEAMGNTIRSVVEALNAPRPANALARHQLAALREEIEELQRDLDSRDDAGLDAADIAQKAARTTRALRRMGESPTEQAAQLAMALNFCSKIATRPAEPPAGYPVWEDYESARLAVLAQGIGPAALSLFALNYPEQALKIDRASLDRLVIAWTAAVEGSRWKVLAAVWKERLGAHLGHETIKSETRKLALVKNAAK